jgi:hypothetical protein
MAPPGTTDPSLGYDAAGNLRGQVQTTNGNTGDATRTTYKYQFNGSYQQTESTTTQGGRTATTNTWRDANGFISNIEQKGEVYDTRYNRAFVNDAQGNALYVNQSAGTTADKGGRIQNEPGGYIGGFIGDAINPGHIQRQLVANGEVLARYGDAPDSENPPKAGDVPKYVNTAEFHLNAPALKLRDTNFSAMSYTVVGGETLKTIARNVLGDSSLWWRIADANGLAVSGDGELTAGQTLSIPKLALNANNADTFQPYDPSRVTGSLDSVLPAPAAQSGGCGGLGKIIMVAVAVVVAAYTAGTFSALLGNAWAGAAAAGATGSIASQVAGNVMGVQDGFNWKSVGLSALSAGITSGLAGTELFGGSGWQATAMRAATANVMTQGIGVLTGLQDRFDWKSVAASAVGGAVGSYVGEQLKTSTMFSDWGKTAADLARGTISGFAAGTAAAVARGGRISIQQVATDAFGNALGWSLADYSSSSNSSQEDLKRSEIHSQNAQVRSEAMYGWSTLTNGLGLKAFGETGLRYGNVVAAAATPDDTRIVSDGPPGDLVDTRGMEGQQLAYVGIFINPATTGGAVGGGYRPVRPDGAGGPPGYDIRQDVPSGTPGFPELKLPSWTTTPPSVQDASDFFNRGLTTVFPITKAFSNIFLNVRDGEKGAGNQPELFDAYNSLDKVPSIYKDDPRFLGLASDPDRGNKITSTGIREGITALEAERQKLIPPGSTRAPGGLNIDIYMGNGVPVDIKAAPSNGYLSPDKLAASINDAINLTRPNGIS